MAKTFLFHIGTSTSGRYPKGSGEDPQRNPDFRGRVAELRKEGLTDAEIAKGFKMSTAELKAKITIDKAKQRSADVAQAIKLKNKGYSNVEGGRLMGLNESSFRSLLNPVLQERSAITKSITNQLKENLDKKEYLDVGIGVERHLGISRTKLNAALFALKDEGYTVHRLQVQQLGTDKKTSLTVLAKPGVEFKEVYKNRDKIRMTSDYSEDGGRSFLGLKPVNSVDSKRIQIRHLEDGGGEKDGVIELRRGVDDISMGNARYAQVRIGVDGTHYLKGMAMYSDNLPKGVDVIFNTNKSSKTPFKEVLKPMKDDIDNPFGATVRQKEYVDSKGNKKLSALNIVNEEGDWGEWKKSISAQVLSKQPTMLAKQQLELAYESKKKDFDEIMSLTNPVIKKKLLYTLADDADSSAVHLEAAALPRQRMQVILSFPNMKENEIYAPNFRDGERVALVRYPHGGIFEIPELVVNNKNKEAQSLIAQARDAVGINHKVAEKLSGADFDGDTVLVIPNDKRSIKTAPSLKGLKNFDPKTEYKGYPGMPIMSEKDKQKKMGQISNLITDMTIKGALDDEIARAVRHSMVVIDAVKHELNHKLSYESNGIAQLKTRYQGGPNKGAATLLSRAGSDLRPDHRKEGAFVVDALGKTKRQYINPKTGEKQYEYTGESYINKKGKLVKKTVKSTKMFETPDALTLSSGTPMETIYGTHANKLKALANKARLAYLNTEKVEYSPSAKIIYAKEVASLQAKLNVALKNAPLERQAQIIANSVVAMKKTANPDMDAAQLKKIKGQALAEARLRVNPKGRTIIEIDDKEWEAIQSRAVSGTTLSKIIDNADIDKIRQRAMPRPDNAIDIAKENKIKRLLASGKTQSQIADQLGISISTVSKLVN